MAKKRRTKAKRRRTKKQKKRASLARKETYKKKALLVKKAPETQIFSSASEKPGKIDDQQNLPDNPFLYDPSLIKKSLLKTISVSFVFLLAILGMFFFKK